MNDEMTVKMFNKCIPDIVRLDRGERIDERQIGDMCDFIDSRFDCADFRLVCILRILFAYPHLVTEETRLRMKRTVLSFKYWMDEPGEDSMCYWSENHQIIFHSCEYLAGQLYPDESFSNSGMTGAAHREKAGPKILNWLRYRWRHGFSEWHSNVYYEEDIAPLSNLLDFCADGEIRKKTAIILDLLLLDMALHSFRGLFAAASGRCYEEQKTDPGKQFTLPITDLLGGFHNASDPDYSGLWTMFYLCRSYAIPEVLRKIARDERTVVIRDSMGLDLSEIGAEFDDPRDIDTTGMFLWGMEAFTNRESVRLTLEIFNRWRLGGNRFLKDLSMVNRPILRKLNLLPALVRLLNPVTQGIAIQRADTYTWKSKTCMLSTAMNHHPGGFADQQHIWQATLSRDISIFATHPAGRIFDDQARNFSPSWWVGSGRLPHAVQHENIHMSLYVIGGRKGFLERELHGCTHAWFPSSQFERVVHEGRSIFGEYRGTYAALTGKEELAFRDGSDSDLIQQGKETFWICELGTAEHWGSFERFIDAVKGRSISYGRKTLTWSSGDLRLELRYKKAFLVNGRPADSPHPRLDSPYGKAERKPAEIALSFDGSGLYLNFETMERKES